MPGTIGERSDAVLRTAKAERDAGVCGCSVFQRAGAALAHIVDGLLGEAVEPAGLDVTLNLLIEAHGVKLVEPSEEARKVVGRQLGDRVFQFFDGHGTQHVMGGKAAGLELERSDDGSA